MPRRIPASSYELSTYNKLFLLLNALTSMVALAVAYPMSGEMMGHSSVAKREEEAGAIYRYDEKRSVRAEEEAAGVYFTITYDEDKKRAEDEEASADFCCYDDDRTGRSKRSEEEAVGYATLQYNEGQKRAE
ncbi:hypothetical protein P692DRAFT_2060059 [Suillus brevipes Sb2]|nr:hypothetical protein P692DRAFT_2060059 [Suillus brevipes Sb2]